ncbi:hypothetical protein CV102_15015 [Natronococcus pandeyae]|uniref:Uncharacterized protein n=1 Tax=Natronococcus pandeyae TaxID=2055836 RepID=A0A8J8Q5L0_9EURY|nr:hypothetical protein [Natronococcus pandeyae]TYL37650.1 hypothetical protein CV102_15015 [Natronococcus pandeyae]
MPSVLSTAHRSNRLLLAVSFALFAGAGAATAAGDTLGLTAGATALAVGGVYCTAHYADRISRKELAQLALGLWIGFLAISGLHLAGLGTVASVVPGSTTVLVHSLMAVTWASLLSSCSATVFLGFREYARTGTELSDEQVLEGETTSDYSTR